MGATTIDDVLAHYGVRGMHWGVRKRRTSSSEPTPVLVKVKPGQPIKTAGGKNQPVAEDAIKVAAARQKARSSGAQSLSNAEMKAIIERMNLESQYKKLNPRQKSLGEKFIKQILDNPDVVLKGTKHVLKDATNPRIVKGIEFADLVLPALKTKKK